jgi:hypothetical protein
VSASSWLIVSIDNKRSAKSSLTTPLKALPLEEKDTCDQSKNYYSKDYTSDEDFVVGDKSYFNLSKNSHIQREVASLTKIMTCYTVLKLMIKLKVFFPLT